MPIANYRKVDFPRLVLSFLVEFENIANIVPNFFFLFMPYYSKLDFKIIIE